MTRRIGARWLLSLIVLAGCGAGSHAPARIAPVATPLLDLRSSFWINLHQRLYAETSPTRPALPQPGAEAFTPAERAIWEAALAFYRQQIPSARSLRRCPTSSSGSSSGWRSRATPPTYTPPRSRPR